MAVARKLAQAGKIGRNESLVICVTGNGLKTQEAVAGKIGEPVHIRPNLAAFEEALEKKTAGVG